MSKTLLLSLFALLIFASLNARADSSDDIIYGTGKSASSLYGGSDDSSPGFSRRENGDLLSDRRDEEEARRRNDNDLQNGFGGTSTRSIGSSVLDQLQPSSGR